MKNENIINNLRYYELNKGIKTAELKTVEIEKFKNKSNEIKIQKYQKNWSDAISDNKGRNLDDEISKYHVKWRMVINQLKAVKNDERANNQEKHNSLEKKNENKYEYGYLDSGSDTCGINTKSWIIDNISDRRVNVSGYQGKIEENVPIVSGITAVDLPSGETVILKVNEATISEEDASTLFSITQMREYGVEVDDIAKKHGGLSYIKKDGYIIPIQMVDSLMAIKLRKPTKDEMNNCKKIELTSKQIWNPSIHNEKELDENGYQDLILKIEKNQGLRGGVNIDDVKQFDGANLKKKKIFYISENERNVGVEKHRPMLKFGAVQHTH
jgi:hypothetical protein